MRRRRRVPKSSIHKLIGLSATIIGCATGIIKAVVLQAYCARWAITACFIAWYILHVASANLQHFVTVAGANLAGVNQAQLNDRLDQRAQVVNAINACANVVRSGKGI